MTERFITLRRVSILVNRKYTVLLLLILLVGAVAGASAAITLGLDQQVAVAYGEVSYVNSDLQVNDYSAVGPGINTKSVDVTIDNTASSNIDGEVFVYLMSGDTVVSSGSSGTTSFSSGTTTINIGVSPNTKENSYDQVDIKIEEV